MFDRSSISVTDFSKQIDKKHEDLLRVLNGAAAMSADLAIPLVQALGKSAQNWLRLQTDYDRTNTTFLEKPR